MTKRHIVIEANTRNLKYWKDIFDFRGLLYFLAWRDLLVRYKQTAFGVLWGIIRPLLTILSMWFIGWLFHSNVPGNTPRILFVCCATLPWQLFSSALSEISNSLIANANLLTKVYFPRLIVPISTLVVSIIDFLIGFVILILLMAYYHVGLHLFFLMVPLLILTIAIAALGLGLFIAVLNVKYRDFRFLVPFLLQIGLYISPIAFSSADVLNNAKIPFFFKFLFNLNPLVGIINGFRWSVLGESSDNVLQGILVAFIEGLLLLGAGIWYFRKKQLKS